MDHGYGQDHQYLIERKVTYTIEKDRPVNR